MSVADHSTFVRTLLLLVLMAGGLPRCQRRAQLRATPVASGFDRPLGMVPVPGRAGTFVVFEQAGRVRVVVNGVTRATDFIDLRADIASGGEQGLLGLAFAPDFTQSGRVFVSFTNRSGDSVIARFTHHGGRSPDAPMPSSPFRPAVARRRRASRNPSPTTTAATSRSVRTGSSTWAWVTADRATTRTTARRIRSRCSARCCASTSRSPTAIPAGYVVPSTNPFVGRSDVLHEIWALGLRNPWRWSFDATSAWRHAAPC